MRLPEPCYSVGLITTYQCNLNCKYCYITRKQNLRMPLETAKSILRPILEKEGDTLLVSLMGAETLMAADMICGLVEWTESEKWRRKCRFFGSTNGTLLTPELKTWFFEHRETITLGLSYDGLHGTQKKNRGRKKGRFRWNFSSKHGRNRKSR